MRSPLNPTSGNHRSEARRGLASLLSQAGGFDLCEAAFLIAAEEYPYLDVERSMERIRLISAEGARTPFPRGGDAARSPVFLLLIAPPVHWIRYFSLWNGR